MGADQAWAPNLFVYRSELEHIDPRRAVSGLDEMHYVQGELMLSACRLGRGYNGMNRSFAQPGFCAQG